MLALQQTCACACLSTSLSVCVILHVAAHGIDPNAL